MTAERFVPDPWSRAGERLFRTGDLVRRRQDGALEFLGRRDSQVKIRGFRVELGEIEAVLTRHPGVKDAVVTVRVNCTRGNEILAYVYGESLSTPSASELREYLRARLPDYMIPAGFIGIDKPRLNPNGKLDRSCLPEAPEFASQAREGGRTPEEEALCQMWQECLGLSGPIGIHDNFFEIGGHSLVATRLVSRVRKSLGINLPLRGLFENPTIAELAELISNLRRENATVSELPMAGAAHRIDVQAIVRGVELLSEDEAERLDLKTEITESPRQ